jgi:UDP-N-acetylenolpyruvoylglucosamine reductase
VKDMALDVRALRARLLGHVAVPGDDDWDEARQAWNLAVDQRPAAVALPETAEDVVAIVEFARANGLRVAPQGTGHNASPLGALDDTVLVKTSRMRGVWIDPEARIARVEAGVIWIEVVNAAAEHGLAALAGSSPDVGVVGYTLGGGLSWLARKHGIGANSVTAVEIVTADGRHLRVDRDHHSDLFWALRGGGGSFGIVTALEFELRPIREVYAGVLFFPIERASEVLHAWREWVEDVPEEMTSVGRIIQVPPIPDLPEWLRGRSFVIVETIYLGDEAEGAALAEPLRKLGPEVDTVGLIPVTALSELHMDPPQPVPGIGDGMLLSAVPAEAIDALVAVAGPGSGSPLVSVELRHLGGAVGRSSPEHGALDRLDGRFLMFAVGIPTDAEVARAVETHVGLVQVTLAPWNAGQMYLNFSERPIGARSMFEADAYRRLRAIKAAYDPEDLVRSNHPVPPARSGGRKRPALRRRSGQVRAAQAG